MVVCILDKYFVYYYISSNILVISSKLGKKLKYFLHL